ncbi:MAG: putative ABC transport system substrate-binding protein [Glaciecola sp.]|jgi:putative ABC transport system substrate-binding protein
MLLDMKYIFKIYCFLLLALLTPQALGKRIVVIKTSDIPTIDHIVEGFFAACSDNITIDVVNMAGSNRHNGEIIAMVKEKSSVKPVDYIFTIGTPATQFAHDSFDDIPIFFSMINNPLQQSFVGKISGIALDVSLSEQIRLLRTILPDINRLGVVYDPKYNEKLVAQMKTAAKLAAVNLQSYQVLSPKKVPDAIRQAVNDVEALIIISDRTVINRQSLKYIVTTTLAHQLPTIAFTKELVNAGFLFGLKPDLYDIGQEAAGYICGSDIYPRRSGDIYSPRSLNLYVNLKTARRVGVVVPEQELKNAESILK